MVVFVTVGPINWNDLTIACALAQCNVACFFLPPGVWQFLHQICTDLYVCRCVNIWFVTDCDFCLCSIQSFCFWRSTFNTTRRAERFQLYLLPLNIYSFHVSSFPYFCSQFCSDVRLIFPQIESSPIVLVPMMPCRTQKKDLFYWISCGRMMCGLSRERQQIFISPLIA